ncbi:hypothetical protein Golax_021887 [Gossypium laxum]|uniref:Uncharacterized protein n=1 Tax=Gossypium laxum TaxID=34288 RepID=A0A7J9AMH0_9ROSI|nr:hypothetical protein [Gossypium laxum]
MVVLSNEEILMLYNEKVIDFNNQKVKRLEETRLSQTRARFNAIAYTRCFISLYTVATGKRISRYCNIILKLVYASSI